MAVARAHRDDDAPAAAGALPNLILIGAMKCGTTALHRYLAAHPEVAMSDPKELNFFVGPASLDGAAVSWSWQHGNWHRGLGWYMSHFTDAPARGESSPGYTSPSHPYVAERIARIAPDARLVYLIRDPLERALSQYHHHRGEGTESRPLADALLDPGSQYLSRSCFHARLLPFLSHFPPDRIFICAQEELADDRHATLRAIHRFLAVDEGFRARPDDEPPPSRPPAPVDRRLRERFLAHVADDAARLRALAGRDFPGWSV